MNPNAMRKHTSITSVCQLSTYYETSARKPDDGLCRNTPLHALEAGYLSANIPVVDFDAVKNHYYNAGDNVPCSVDAVTFERDGVYLVEFKCGDADKAQLYRKIYDSIMLLIEFDNYTFKKARAEIVYIVVSAKLQPWTAQQKSLSRAFGFCRNPWEKYRQKYDNWNLAPFEGVVVKSVYTMPPDMFDFFAKYKKWK